MSDLLDFAIEAHGGLNRWNEFTSITASLSIAGAIWEFKQQAGLLTDKVVEVDTRAERVTIAPFGGQGNRSVFVPKRLVLETTTGAVIDQRDDPETAFRGQTLATPWDKFHVAYFASEALWTYLNLPFLYTYPGFQSEEIEPWEENGELWRRLKVTFPDHVSSHTKVQTTHFGSDGLMRRHDYTVDILGGNPGANYSEGYREFQGIKMPTRRRIFAYDAEGRKVSDPLLVSIDFKDITFA